MFSNDNSHDRSQVFRPNTEVLSSYLRTSGTAGPIVVRYTIEKGFSQRRFQRQTSGILVRTIQVSRFYEKRSNRSEHQTRLGCTGTRPRGSSSTSIDSSLVESHQTWQFSLEWTSQRSRVFPYLFVIRCLYRPASSRLDIDVSLATRQTES